MLVSETMLQQTGVERVLPKFLDFMARFPTLETLASSSTGDVIRLWSGLGYNRRAVWLQEAARKALARWGRLPDGVQDLASLPGIGPYTARAVACFAFGAPVAVADTNVRRVLTRLLLGSTSSRSTPVPAAPATDDPRPGIVPGASATGNRRPGIAPAAPATDNRRPGIVPGAPATDDRRPGIVPGAPATGNPRPGIVPGAPATGNRRPGIVPGASATGNRRPGIVPGAPANPAADSSKPAMGMTERQMLTLAESVLPPGRAYDWNQALMDLGATICTHDVPRCLICPLQSLCKSFPFTPSPISSRALREPRPRWKEEPFSGSRRYYRGRIIHALRQIATGAVLPLEELGRQIKPDFTAGDTEWLRMMVEELNTEGLVQITGDGQVALPA